VDCSGTTYDLSDSSHSECIRDKPQLNFNVESSEIYNTTMYYQEKGNDTHPEMVILQCTHDHQALQCTHQEKYILQCMHSPNRRVTQLLTQYSYISAVKASITDSSQVPSTQISTLPMQVCSNTTPQPHETISAFVVSC